MARYKGYASNSRIKYSIAYSQTKYFAFYSFFFFVTILFCIIFYVEFWFSKVRESLRVNTGPWSIDFVWALGWTWQGSGTSQLVHGADIKWCISAQYCSIYSICTGRTTTWTRWTATAVWAGRGPTDHELIVPLMLLVSCPR